MFQTTNQYHTVVGYTHWQTTKNSVALLLICRLAWSAAAKGVATNTRKWLEDMGTWWKFMAGNAGHIGKSCENMGTWWNMHCKWRFLARKTNELFMEDSPASHVWWHQMAMWLANGIEMYNDNVLSCVVMIYCVFLSSTIFSKTMEPVLAESSLSWIRLVIWSFFAAQTTNKQISSLRQKPTCVFYQVSIFFHMFPDLPAKIPSENLNV